MNDKPEKIIYGQKFQNEIHKKIKKFIVKKYSKLKCVNQILACGGVIKKTFGIYTNFHHDRYGSDADIIIIIDPKYKIPKSWEKLQEWDFSTLYRLDNLDHLIPATNYFDFKPIHLIHAKVFNIEKHNEEKFRNYPVLKNKDYKVWYTKKKINKNIPMF